MVHCYKLGGFNIVVDSESGSIHSVDEVAFDAIRLFGYEQEEETRKQLKKIHTEITDEDISELLLDIRRLMQRGKLYSNEQPSGAVRHKDKDQADVKALCLNVSHVCNMSCAYCFAGKGQYGGVGGLMDIGTGMAAIDFLLKNSIGRSNLDVDFFGGEPLLNWGVVKGIVEYARKKEQESGKKFRFTLTTNALLIDDEVISFSNREIHNVVLSLDGRMETHDAMRKLPGDKGSYAEILPLLKKMVEERRGKGYYIRGTYTRKNLDFATDILHIADLGFKELSMEPVVSKPGGEFSLEAGDLPEICRQYEILAIEMLRRKRIGRGFNFYHYILDLKGGPCIHKRIAGCGVGTEYLAVTPGGELFPCHQFIGDNKFLMGDVWRGISNRLLRNEFLGNDIFSRSECRVCWARLFCSGGCAANAYHETSSLSGVYELGCEMFKKRLECAIMLQVAETVK